MARIRTIKPEFQNSQSMGRVSRDARLTFIELWPQCDDAGRIRANSRMLASILFPYDGDAPNLIDGWLSELENECCIVRYVIDKDEYLQICHWDHQKIDHPQPSKLPASPDKKRVKSKRSVREQSAKPLEPVENVRAVSSTLTGTSIITVSGPGPGEEQAAVAAAFDAYNEIAKSLSWPVAQKLDKKRIVGLRQRLAECGGIDGWNAAMERARASPFLRGDTERAEGHEGWIPDLDFFLKQSKFTQLMEGKYDQRGRVRTKGFDALREGASRAAGLDTERGQGMEGGQDFLQRLAISGGS